MDLLSANVAHAQAIKGPCTPDTGRHLLGEDTAIEYCLLQPIPELGIPTGFVIPSSQSNDLTVDGLAYLAPINSLYNVLLVAVIIAAVLVGVIGGIRQAASGASPSQKTIGKEEMGRALIGVGLALVAFLAFNRINPQITNPDAGLFSNFTGSATAPGRVESGIGNIAYTDQYDHDAALAALKTADVELNPDMPHCRDKYPPPIYPDGPFPGECSDFEGVRKVIIADIKTSKNDCSEYHYGTHPARRGRTGPFGPCNLKVTDCTGPGHSEEGWHYSGAACDVRLSLDIAKWVQESGEFIDLGVGQGFGPWRAYNNRKTGCTWVKEPNHWHVICTE